VRILPAALILLVGCGGSSRKARNAADARRKELEDSRPTAPYETRERVAYSPGERCGQGPYRIEMGSLRAKYGEQIIIYACGQHEIAGNYRITVEYADKRLSTDTSESAFGWGRTDNAACKANRATDVVVASDAGGGTGGGSPKPGSSKSGGGAGGGAHAAPPAAAKPVALARVTEIPEQCGFRTGVFNTTYYSNDDSIAFDGHLVLDLWSDEPNDYEGLVFVVEKKSVIADMTPLRWKVYLDESRAWSERYNAFIDGEVAAGRTTLVDSKVKTPPPPPPRVEVQPPKPSVNARWIPGYWHHADTRFHWIAGLWQVPDEDIAKDLTVHAPTPPPAAPPPETQPARPTVTAVWTPGQWQWDGRAYVWIAGSWRIPPSQEHTWTPAGWTIGARGAIFVPGGWRVRIRR
jgi:WXXGXW repeat (2 copies)